MLSPRQMAVLCAVLSAAGFSAKAIFVKLGYREGMDAPVQLVWRMLLTLPFFLPLAWRAERRVPLRWRRGDVLTILAIGLFGYYLASLFDFIGLRYISTSLERLTLFLNPTFVLLISAVFLRRRYGWSVWAGVAVSYAGIVLAFLYGAEQEAGPDVLRGLLWVLASAVSYSIYLVIMESSVRRLGSSRTAAWGTLCAALMMFVHYFVAGGRWNDLLAHTPKAFAWMACMALISTVLPIWLMTRAAAVLDSGRVANISLLGPVLTMIFSVLVLGEAVTWATVLGLVLVVGGVAVTLRK